eukprot:TRINITY_DN8322_c0_g1_i11.p1 TRINITY_DN8322_c0_g1~~TRINITY_DN8322_c0_g1_i11.p1  ORF type:complete len:327 (-),score=-30.62 TRINITY_DN8322_c0_g1_i11:186-1166(-)
MKILDQQIKLLITKTNLFCNSQSMQLLDLYTKLTLYKTIFLHKQIYVLIYVQLQNQMQSTRKNLLYATRNSSILGISTTNLQNTCNTKQHKQQTILSIQITTSSQIVFQHQLNHTIFSRQQQILVLYQLPPTIYQYDVNLFQKLVIQFQTLLKLLSRYTLRVRLYSHSQIYIITLIEKLVYIFINNIIHIYYYYWEIQKKHLRILHPSYSTQVSQRCVKQEFTSLKSTPRNYQLTNDRPDSVYSTYLEKNIFYQTNQWQQRPHLKNIFFTRPINDYRDLILLLQKERKFRKKENYTLQIPRTNKFLPTPSNAIEKRTKKRTNFPLD